MPEDTLDVLVEDLESAAAVAAHYGQDVEAYGFMVRLAKALREEREARRTVRGHLERQIDEEARAREEAVERLATRLSNHIYNADEDLRRVRYTAEDAERQAGEAKRAAEDAKREAQYHTHSSGYR